MDGSVDFQGSGEMDGSVDLQGSGVMDGSVDLQDFGVIDGSVDNPDLSVVDGSVDLQGRGVMNGSVDPQGSGVMDSSFRLKGSVNLFTTLNSLTGIFIFENSWENIDTMDRIPLLLLQYAYKTNANCLPSFAPVTMTMVRVIVAIVMTY